MKNVIILILIFLSLKIIVKAEDVRDFEIEGMSVGDSLLDYFSENEIKKSYSDSQYPNKEFIIYFFKSLPSFTQYEGVTVAVKSNDKNYTIYDIGGSIYFPNNFDNCLDTMKETVKDLNQIFNKAKTGSGKHIHPYDKSGKSYQEYNVYILKTGDNAQIVCINWSKDLEEFGHTDELNLTLGLKEYGKFVNERAYKEP
tara:strand:+ start:119 stop:712 length:594 start_codon:yes stop_codon:yes gene_type:complete